MKGLYVGLALLILLCLCPMVSAEVINYDYTDSASYSATCIASKSRNAYWDALYFTNIQASVGIKTAVYGFNRAPFGSNPDWVSKTQDLTFRRSTTTGSIIGHGTLTITNIWSGETVSSVIACIEFDDWDVSGLSGPQTITINPDEFSVEGCIYQGVCISGGTAYSVINSYYTVDDLNNYAWPAEYDTTFGPDVATDTGLKFTTYYDVDMHQSLTYTENANSLDLNFNRNGLGNLVSIIDTDDLVLYSATKDEDIDLIVYNYPVTVNVTNPYTSTIWSNQIPETTGPSPLDPAEFTAYIYDAQTGNLISWSSLNKTYSGEYALPSTTHDPDGVIQDVVYWDETDWALFTASATGYLPDTTGFNYTSETAPPGSSNQMTFHLVPDGSLGNNSYALSFMVNQEISPASEIFTRAVDATVTCDGEQHLTGPTGTTWFNVTTGEHAYTVAKNGFETVQGTTTISGNMLQTVYLHLSPDVPTVENTTGESGEVGDEDMHEAVAEAYAEFGAFIPEAVMIGCVLFLLSMFKKF